MSAETNDNESTSTRPPLPAYVLVRPEGVFINLSPPPAQDILRLFIDRLFGSGACLVGLDYAVFSTLLYGENPVAALGGGKEVRLAKDIVRFPPQRKDLYRTVTISDAGDRAEYVFEPVYVDVDQEVPVYGEPGADGVAPVVRHEHKTESRRARLNFDEFVADVWLKGVRTGINVEAVLAAMAGDATLRMDFAHQIEPTESRDAQVVEESDLLRQDNAPLILPNGKADLRRARNRFPQVAKDTPLLRKIPRVLGKPGFKVTGDIVEARLPLDLDLGKLGGEGTRIDRTDRGEVLVANMDGFVVIDEASGEIWITAKIENKGGISAKSTGDIRLDVDEFVEHGEVQEGRIVEGKHMTFHSDVFGSVVSEGGNIQLESNLSGGRARSMGGNVSVKGRAFSALIEAWDGEVAVGFAESCTIIGRIVSVERAVNCEIIADEVQIGVSEGSAIAARKVKVAVSNVRKNHETAIAILVPDVSALDQQIARGRNAIAEIKRTLEIKSRQLDSVRANPKMAKILALGDKIREGTVRLTPEQQAEWNRVVERFAPMMKESAYLMEKCQKLEEDVEQVLKTRASSGAGESCQLDEVQGDTVVRVIHTNQGAGVFRELPAHEVKMMLRHSAAAKDRLYHDQRGSFEWHFKVPEYQAG